MSSFAEMIVTIIHAPLDIIIGIITDGVKYEENLRKYKQDKKKHLYYDQVPAETQKTWNLVIEKKEEINLERTIRETKEAAASFLLGFNKTKTPFRESEEDESSKN